MISTRELRRLFFLLVVSGCEGPRGPAGQMGGGGEAGIPGAIGEAGAPGSDGDAGPIGPVGPSTDGGLPQPGVPGCDGLPAGVTPGLVAALSVSSPANGQFFVAGEQPRLTIQLANRCGRTLGLGDLGTANLYAWGPRAPLSTKTAAKLLNASTDRTAAQHHYINLIKPAYADATKPNLQLASDGIITYTLAPVSDEPAGTYTAGLWVEANAGVDQLFPLADFQIGSATVESYTNGSGAQSACLSCHQAPSGKVYMHHIHPGHSPFGDYSLDSNPVADCKACHNNDGYSVNPIVRKVHGLHRGANQLSPGAAHPEYGLANVDSTLASYTDVVYPAMPNGEKDCATCHVDNRWQVASRKACGTCHDQVFFDTGVMNPPEPLPLPNNANCATINDCTAAFGSYGVQCNANNQCERTIHPKQTDDSQCVVCHSADNNGILPVAATHEILQRTHNPSLAIVQLKRTSTGSGPGGSLVGGDTPSINFQVTSGGTPVTTLAALTALAPNLMVSGPSENRQRIYANGTSSVALASKGTLALDGNGGFNYTFATPIPAQALAPINATPGPSPSPLPGASPPAGTYTLWLWLSQTTTVGSQSFRNTANGTIDFQIDSSAPVAPRQVITTAACNRCHVDIQAHGGGRQGDATVCSTCHTQGAVDRTVGSTANTLAGAATCSSDAQCPGYPSWGACDPIAHKCTVTVDPTPNASIDFSQLIHNVHFARLREGYSERDNLPQGKYQILGFNNGISDFSGVLLPQDVRNCTTCHADTGATCSASAPCGFGQACTGGKCVNDAWLAPSARVCLSCHDSDDANGHVAVNTWQGPTGPVETCGVCHGQDGQFSVDKVHNVSSPFVPPYSREPNN